MYKIEIAFVWTSTKGKVLTQNVATGIFGGVKAKIRFNYEAKKAGHSYYKLSNEKMRTVWTLENEDLNKLIAEEETFTKDLQEKINSSHLEGISKVLLQDKGLDPLRFFADFLDVLIFFTYYKDGEKFEIQRKDQE